MEKRVYDNILQTIGNTPLVRINSLLPDCPAIIYAKVEYFNPGQSIKDRIGLRMVEDAEKAGLLKPDRKSTRLNSSHVAISYAVFCLKKKRASQATTCHHLKKQR